MRAAFAQLRGHCLAQRFGLCQRGRRPARAGAQLHINVAWGDPELRTPLVRASASGSATTLAQAEALGEAVAAQLRERGAH